MLFMRAKFTSVKLNSKTVHVLPSLTFPSNVVVIEQQQLLNLNGCNPNVKIIFSFKIIVDTEYFSFENDYFNSLIDFYLDRGSNHILKCFQGYHLTSGATETVVTCVAGVWAATGHPLMLLKCLPKCVPTCKNWGLCVEPDRCLCSGLFGGDRCQHPLCEEEGGVLRTFYRTSVREPGVK